MIPPSGARGHHASDDFFISFDFILGFGLVQQGTVWR